MKTTLTHEINCSEKRFWELFFDPEFNRVLYKEKLHFPEFEIVDKKETETSIWRKSAGMPKMDLPGPIAKMLGSNFRYTEEGTLDKAKSEFKFKTTPSALAEKLKNEGSVRIEKISDDKIRRVVELVIEAKIFGLGGTIESISEKQFRQGWETSAAFMNEYLKTHP